MKHLFLPFFALCMAVAANAQEVPYSKYLDFTKKEFKENKFKYDDETNTWSLRKSSSLNTTLSVIAILADAYEEIRPSKNDYSILVQLGKEEKASYVKVVFYNDETYHKLLTFMKDNGEDIVDTSSGKIIKYQAFCASYALELNMEQRNRSRTSAHTADPKALKNVDESYNKYTFIVKTDVEPWSEYLDKKAAKKAKRDAKGKKKKTVDELM